MSGVVRLVLDDDPSHVNNSETPKAMTFRPVSNWTGSNMDPDSVKRHWHTLKRAGFKNHQHVQGAWGF